MTIISLIDDWNNSLEKNRDIIELNNKELKQSLEEGKIEPEVFMKSFQPVPTAVKHPSISWSRWFLRSWGWSLLTKQSDAQLSLPFEHYDMVQARSLVASMVDVHKVHPALLVNFDQLWRSSWQCSGKLLFKDRGHAGKRVHRAKAPKRMEKKLHAVKGARRSVTDSC